MAHPVEPKKNLNIAIRGGMAGRAILAPIFALTLVAFYTGRGWLIFVSMTLFILVPVSAGLFGKVALARDWHPPELHLAEPSVAIGQEVLASYRHEAKDAAALVDHQVRASLICSEWVRYRSGTDTVTRQEVLRELPVRVDTHPDDLAVVATLTATIPTDATASFELDDNRVEWLLRVDIDAADASDPSNQFPVTVRPEVHDG